MSCPTPLTPLLSGVHDCLQGGLGSPPRRPDGSRQVVRLGNSAAHQCVRIEGSSTSPTGFQYICQGQVVLTATDNTTVVSYISKQGDELRPLVHPIVENTGLVDQKPGFSEGQTHSGLPECGSRQTLQTGTSDPNGVVSLSGGFSGNMQNVVLSTSEPVCHQVQHQTSSGCPVSVMAGSRPVCVSTSSHSTLSATVARPVDLTIRQDPAPQSGESQPPCFASGTRASRGSRFFEALAIRIEAPQRRSTRKVYEDGERRTRWTSGSLL